MAYDALTIAKYIIQKSNEEGHPVSNLQLQKMLYYIQREFLQRRNSPLFNDDFEAWRFGPVVPDVYRKYCGSAALPLTLYDFDSFDGIDESTKEMMDPVISEKAVKNPWDMVRDLHQPGKAWAIVYRDGEGIYDIIPKDLIRKLG